MSAQEAPIHNPIGERIRELRRSRNISQETLAFNAGLPVVSLAKIEQGKIQRPAFQAVWKIATALGTTLDEFVQGIEPMN